MIDIMLNPNADTRTAPEIPSEEALMAATDEHISHVQQALSIFANLLERSGEIHDFTKKAYSEEFYNELTTLKPGDEFKNGKWYKLHISRERHHLLSKAPDDVNLVDVLEYISDGVVAGYARSGSVYDITIPDELLQKAFRNTVELHKGQINLVKEEKADD